MRDARNARMADVQLYLIRHGLADEPGPAYADDTKRPLTREGVARLKKEARALIELKVGFDVIITSPLVRALQTTEAFAEGMLARPAVEVSQSLAPEGSYGAVIEELGKHPDAQSIALVGHEPSIGELAARLVGSRRAMIFKKGAICRIDVAALPPARPGTLIWFLPPKVLRRVADAE